MTASISGALSRLSGFPGRVASAGLASFQSAARCHAIGGFRTIFPLPIRLAACSNLEIMDECRQAPIREA